MFIFDYHLFVNLLKFCDKSHLFPLLLTSKEVKDLTWRHLIDFLKIDLNELFFESCVKINLKKIKLLLQNPNVDPGYENNTCIAFSCYYENIEVVKLLLQDPRVDPNVKFNNPLKLALIFRHTEVIKLLLMSDRIKKETKEKYKEKYGYIQNCKSIITNNIQSMQI